jgi:hypothetical protein
MFEIQVSETRSTQELPSPGERGWRGGGNWAFHPHPNHLPSREREIFCGFEHSDFEFVSSFDIRNSDFQNRRF